MTWTIIWKAKDERRNVHYPCFRRLVCVQGLPPLAPSGILRFVHGLAAALLHGSIAARCSVRRRARSRRNRHYPAPEVPQDHPFAAILDDLPALHPLSRAFEIPHGALRIGALLRGSGHVL